MSVQSMTGFARATGDRLGLGATWELRSVNGKGLEVRTRLPSGAERLEAPVRAAIGQRLSRGNIQAVLSLSRPASGAGQPIVNEELLRDLAELSQRLVTQFGAAPARADGLLALRGVLEQPGSEASESLEPEQDAFLLELLGEALDALEAMRAAEGAALLRVLSGLLDQTEAIIRRVEADPSREPAAIRERLALQLKPLLDGNASLDPDRLMAEAALLATRADIREEIDRTLVHVAAARAMLATGGPAGRRLDFLAQEFNREANTLCSKSNSAAVTSAGLELKAVVDRFREQVQNLE